MGRSDKNETGSALLPSGGDENEVFGRGRPMGDSDGAWYIRMLWVRPRRIDAGGIAGTGRVPVASIGLYALGQLILTLAIAVGRVGPLTGIIICLLWMTCGLLLVAAQITGTASESSD